MKDETNRQTLYRIVREIQGVADDEAISPTPYDHLYQAIASLNRAAEFVLDMNERDTGKVIA